MRTSGQCMPRHRQILGLVTGLALLLPIWSAGALEDHGNQFLAFKKLQGWTKSSGQKRGEVLLTSPEIVARIDWDELIVSWNAEMPEGAYLKLETRAFYLSGPTKWYVMGLWSDSEKHPRESVLKQKDENGNVETDTLVLKRHARRLQLRVTLGQDGMDTPRITYLGLALTDSTVPPAHLPPNKKAWGRTLPVPEKSQMAYPNGNVICSPTTVSMMLCFWAERLGRPELDRDVPEVVKGVFDRNWKGTGNWVFNTAYAGSFEGMRAYVTRMSDVSELEDWISAGMPVGLSLCYDLLRGRPSRPSGHLVVCVGFTADGDPVINDPGTTLNVRKVFPRKNLVKAWAYSRNAAYLIYPEDASVPKDRFGHWDSWTSRQRVSTERAVSTK